MSIPYMLISFTHTHIYNIYWCVCVSLSLSLSLSVCMCEPVFIHAQEFQFSIKTKKVISTSKLIRPSHY